VEPPKKDANLDTMLKSYCLGLFVVIRAKFNEKN